jgi:activator of HSP90 ATPase
MVMTHCNRRQLALWTAGFAAVATAASAKMRGEISYSSPAIHQEIVLPASAGRVYRTLTVADEFDKVVRLSDAMSTSSSMKARLGATPTAIDARAGGAFSLFGGYISGYNAELVPDTRLVQAWRAASWDPGLFSIAHFALEDHGTSTRLIFDHTGFPKSETAHLAAGWHANYWRPMAKVLAQAN